MKSSKSQNETYLTLRMDDRTSKHLVTGLRIDAQQMAANILAGGVDKLLLSCVFHLFLSGWQHQG